MTTVTTITHDRLVRIASRTLWMFAVFMALLAIVPQAASAHAQLEGTSPEAGSTVQTPPRTVTMTFDEDVGLQLGGLRVYGPSGDRVDDGNPRAVDHVVSVGVDSGTPGSYAVSWRVISADGHPIQGAFLYNVGHASTGTTAIDRARAASTTDPSLEVAFGIARGLYLLAIMVAAGGVIVSLGIAPGLGMRWVRTACVVVIVATAAGFVLEAAIAGGFGLGETLRGEVLRSQAGTVYGRTALLRAAVALALLLVLSLRRYLARWTSYVAVAVAVTLACVQSFGGHAVTARPEWLRVSLDMAHILAASVWIGGLVQIAARPRGSMPTARMLTRYSRAALVSVAVLVASGLYAAWDEIGLSWSAATGTTYGLLVLCKAALLVATLPLANRNRVRHVPAVAASPDTAWPRLRRYVWGELALLAIVIAATAWLVQTAPARTKAGPIPPFVYQRVRLPSGSEVGVIVDPARIGQNQVHMSMFDEQGAPDNRVTQMTLTATLTDPDIGPLDIRAPRAGAGHFIARSAQFPYVGDWDFALRVQRGPFTEERTHFRVRISPQTITRQP